MKGFVKTLVVLSAALPLAAIAQQHEQTRQGFGISFGIGAGSAATECDICDGGRETGASGYLRLGGYVRPDLFVAFESNGFVMSADGVDTTGGFYSAAVQWYPNVEKGFYIKGNLGLAGVVAEYDWGDEAEVSALGIGFGVGYDWRVGRNFSLTPYANIVFTGKGDIKFNGFSIGEKASFNLIQVGLGFTWH
jgi:hypothetical protein